MNIILDKLDDVEESDRQFFEETEDKKFKFNRAKFEDTAKAGLIKKNKELHGKLKDAEKLGKFKDVSDDDWTKFQEWKDGQNDDDDDPPKDDDDPKGKKSDSIDIKKVVKDTLKKAQEEHTKALTTAIKAKDDEIAAEKLKFDTYRFEQDLTNEALEAGVIGARLRKFKSAAVDERIFGYHEGKLVVLDEDGEPTSETPAERMKKLSSQDEWKFFFEAKEVGGGSGHQKTAAKTGSKELKRSKMSPREKSDYIKQHGNDAFLKLPL